MPAAGNVVGARGSAPPRRSLPANGPSFLRRGPEVRWGGVGARPARADATPAHQVELAGRDLGHAVRPADAARSFPAPEPAPAGHARPVTCPAVCPVAILRERWAQVERGGHGRAEGGPARTALAMASTSLRASVVAGCGRPISGMLLRAV